jgi:hypothetical protein
LETTLSGPVPRQIGDVHTEMRVAYLLVMDEGDRYVVDADASSSGWIAFGTGPEGEVPVKVSIEGRAVRMTVRWEDIGGVQAFGWLASVTWRSDRAGSSSYAFDSIPVDGFARYP